MKANFKSIATTFINKLFGKKVKENKPQVWVSPKVEIPVKEYNKTGVSFFHGDINKQRQRINKVKRNRSRNKMASHSRQINRKAA